MTETPTPQESRSGQEFTSGPDEAVNAVLAAARLLVALSARSVAERADTVTLPQLRVLLMVSSRSRLDVGAVAENLDVHPSAATRAVDHLVAAGLLQRHDDPVDRCNLLLSLTPRGEDLVEGVMTLRRQTIATIADKLTPDQREDLRSSATALAAAGKEIPHPAAWPWGWSIGG